MIELTLIGDSALIFNPADAAQLRESHRIVGELIGCLPAHSHQNSHLGIPLKLSREETTLLLKKGLVRFKPLDNFSGHCTEEELRRHDEFLESSYSSQVVAAAKSREDEIDAVADRIVAGKRKRQTSDNYTGDERDSSDRRRILEEVKSRIRPLATERAMVRTFDSNPFVRGVDDSPGGKPCACPSTVDPSTSPAPRFEPARWRLPSSRVERLRCATFEHFWSVGYFLTNGAKFGGDFLAYPGDPLRYHSFYVVVCVDHEETLSTRDVVTFARLGTSVKKTVVLCSLDEEDELIVTSLEWSGWN